MFASSTKAYAASSRLCEPSTLISQCSSASSASLQQDQTTLCLFFAEATTWRTSCYMQMTLSSRHHHLHCFVDFTATINADFSSYHNIIGALQYLTMTRPDLQKVVQQACLHKHAATKDHQSLVKGHTQVRPWNTLPWSSSSWLSAS